ncbi:unnamed protein product [Chilo suppressalis]|uniref:C-type lectin domain-containing protein n=1 Tax=Chilo suppressalis TaxID=168631 RepID=A0ABN8BDG9_CHISP|nr:unnamed protein product [Chilo suppressalis]
MCFTILIILVVVSTPISANILCDKHNQSPQIPKYHLMEKCHRSKLGIAAKANFASLSSCQRLGIAKKALALNFSPPDAAIEGAEPLEYTCEVLKCAEVDGGLSLVNDSRYDYYSIYAKPIPHVNATCVPASGMFRLLQKRLNFTQAVVECRNMSGVLPDVTSEQRTDALAQVLAGAGVDAAFVGLRRNNRSSFHGINGGHLDCTSYRAWAPGHPRRYADKFDCVVITKHRMWQSVSCKNEQPVLCELLPNGPYKRGSIFTSTKVEQNNYTNNDV